MLERQEDRAADRRARSARIASLLTRPPDLQSLADCDVVIEAVTENEAIKTGHLRSSGRSAPRRGDPGQQHLDDSDLADGPLMAASRSVRRHALLPSRPPDGARRGDPRASRPSDQTVATLVALARRLGKTPIVVRDCPGFLITRVLFPYLSQALQLLQEGCRDGRDRRRPP